MAPPKLFALLALAVLLALAGGGLALATAAGWEAQAPAALALQSYAPREGPRDAYDLTLDHGTFEVAGTTYAAEFAGPALVRGVGAYYQASLLRIAGEGGLAWPASLVLLEANETRGEADRASPTADGRVALVADTPLAPGEHDLRAELLVRTYRDAAWGAWRGADIVLTFEAAVIVEAAREAPAS